MDILILGNTAREHALAWKFAESRRTGDIFCTSPYSGVDVLAKRVASRADAPADALVIPEAGVCLCAWDDPLPDTSFTVDCLTDGDTIIPLPAVQLTCVDGLPVAAEAPAPDYTADLADYAMQNFFIPHIAVLRASGIVRFTLALENDMPFLLAVHAGFDELDAIALLPLLRGELAPLLTACKNGTLAQESLRLHDLHTAVAMLGAMEPDAPISGVSQIASNIGVFFGAVTYREETLYTAGERALFVCARAATAADARREASIAAKTIAFNGIIRFTW